MTDSRMKQLDQNDLGKIEISWGFTRPSRGQTLLIRQDQQRKIAAATSDEQTLKSMRRSQVFTSGSQNVENPYRVDLSVHRVIEPNHTSVLLTDHI